MVCTCVRAMTAASATQAPSGPRPLRLFQAAASCHHRVKCAWQCAISRFLVANWLVAWLPMSGTLAAITASSQLRRWSQALDLLESSRHLRVKPSAALYTAAIDACGAGGHWASAVKLFDELQSMMTPDVVCFGAVIAALSTSTVWERCLATLTSMYEWRIDINIACATEAVPASDHAMHARRMSITDRYYY